jgi:hypothetical protein
LGNGHVDQFVEVVSPDQIQALFQLGVQSATESISFLGVRISMVACVLAQVIESLCVLQYSAVPLGKRQNFIELPLNESFCDTLKIAKSNYALRYFCSKPFRRRSSLNPKP